MHERNTAIEKDFDILLQVTQEHVLSRRFKQSIKWTAKVTNINKYV